MNLAVSDVHRREKTALRAAMRGRRASVDAVEARRAGAQCASLLEPFLDGPQGLAERSPIRALVYSPVQGELDTVAIDAMLRHRAGGAIIAYPRVLGGGRMSLHVATPGELVPGIHGIAEPDEHLPVLDAATLDLVIVPGLAFDALGHRLGFGGGYYDRLLSSTRQALRVGVCHHFQILDDVPVEPHDERLDLVVHAQLIVTGARPLPLRARLTKETP